MVLGIKFYGLMCWGFETVNCGSKEFLEILWGAWREVIRYSILNGNQDGKL